jgi:dihydrofolate synthase/folylpolyglutamate synthase
MQPSDLSTLFAGPETASPAETYRRVGVFLNALAAFPKKSWRPRINSRGVRAEGPGLARMRCLLDRLDMSFRGRSVVHVAGTSGKGSTALMIAESLHAAGRRTAAFFSPHVTSLSERFWVCGRAAGSDLVGRAARRVAGVAAEMAGDAEMGPPSYFESALALLLLCAEEGGCEFVVLEAGLGGTYDATNAVTPGVLDVLTSIGLDHTDLLGDTVEQIARDKAGIITPGGCVITAALAPEAMGEVQAAAAARAAALHASPEAEAVVCGEDGCRFTLHFQDGIRWEGVRTRMMGAHQAANAALAAGACRLLGLEEGDIRAGLGEARLPCRIERMPGDPPVILDGAHNRAKIRALANTLGGIPADRRLFVLGAIGDKDYAALAWELAGELAGPADRYFVTLPPGDAPRPGLSPKKFARALREAGAREVEEFVDPWQAFGRAIEEAGESDLVVVAGSLFLAGELRKRWVSEEQIAGAGSAFHPEVWK